MAGSKQASTGMKVLGVRVLTFVNYHFFPFPSSSHFSLPQFGTSILDQFLLDLRFLLFISPILVSKSSTHLRTCTQKQIFSSSQWPEDQQDVIGIAKTRLDSSIHYSLSHLFFCSNTSQRSATSSNITNVNHTALPKVKI